MSRLSLEEALRLAVAHHRAGQLADAERYYRAILTTHPNHPDANHNLGVLIKATGQPALALPFLKAALEAYPAQVQYWASLVGAHIGTGKLDDAWCVIDLAKNYGFDERCLHPFLERLVELYQQRKYLEMEGLAREITEHYPSNSFAIESLALSLKNQKKYSEANTTYLQVLQIEPGSVGALTNFAHCLNEQGRYEEGLSYATQATEYEPNHVGAWVNRGTALLCLARVDEAAKSLQKALAIAPQHAEANYNLGLIFLYDANCASAALHFRSALATRPEYPEALAGLANACAGQGQTGDARIYFEKASINCRNQVTIWQGKLLLPVIASSIDDVRLWRRRYQQGLESLLTQPSLPGGEVQNIGLKSFYLAYHGMDDLSIMVAQSRLFRKKAPILNYTADHLKHWKPDFSRRIRVGFISQFLVGHTIGKLNQGFLRHLNRQRFEVILIHAPGAKFDAFSDEIEKLADLSLRLPLSLQKQQQLINDLSLDVLFYPDIGMSWDTYLLAHARLAPVQAVSWGHPVTTGVDTLDYFVSADCIETVDADSHYSERLIRMHRLPCFYQPLMVPKQIPARTVLGLPESGTLYGCPQSLFKFHPEFDSILAEIAFGDPTGHIVVLEGKEPAWAEVLRNRWAKNAPILNERVLFLPRQPQDRFMALMAHFDVLLDPIHFGSGNSLYEALVYGTPIVTWPGHFMRGRIVAGAYRQLGIAEAPVALRLEDYAPLALSLGCDAERRSTLRQLLKAATRELFSDIRAVREFENFLEDAVVAAGRRERLPTSWQPRNGQVNNATVG